jgi:hypothetical protein
LNEFNIQIILPVAGTGVEEKVLAVEEKDLTVEE